MDNENRNDLITGGDTPEDINGAAPEEADINDAVEGLNKKYEGLSEEEFRYRTGIVVPEDEMVFPDSEDNSSESAGDDTLTIDTDAVNAALEAAESDDVTDAQSEAEPQTPPAGQYNYTGAYNPQFNPANQQPFWQNGNQQGNGYQPPYGWQQNNGWQQPPYGNVPPYGYQPPYGNGGYNPPPAGSNAPKKKSKGMKVFIGLIAAIVVLSVALIGSIFSGDKASEPQENTIEGATSSVQQTKPDTGNVGDIQANAGSIDAGEAVTVAQIAKPFNVGILVYKNNSLYTEGSGVIVKEDNDGKFTYIVTCAHVVNHSGVALSVLLEDGTEYQADLVGMDTRTDLAVVRIEEAGLPVAEIASSEELVVGQTVYAVGNPGGSEFFGSVTNGIISAIARPVSSSTGYEMECIQHTSAINPGNSGGALVNGSGQLIGINSMKIASTEYEGMGFSVPSDVVVDVFNSIIENGYVAGRAKLGISYTTPSGYSQTYAMYVQMKGLPSGTIVIAEIAADSDLASKDVKKGDMIIAVNGKKMSSTDMLSEMIEDMSAGDTLTLTIVRVNAENWTQTEMNVKVSLVEDRGTSTPAAEDDNSSNQTPFDNGSGSGGYSDWYDYYKDYFGY